MSVEGVITIDYYSYRVEMFLHSFDMTEDDSKQGVLGLLFFPVN